MTGAETNTDTPDASGERARSEKTWRLFAIVGPLAAFALIVAPIVVSRGSLPDPMNLSWNGDGAPKNPRSISSYIAIQSLFAAFASIGFITGGLRRFARVSHNATAVLMASVATATFAMLTLQTVLTNRGADDWQTVAEPSDLWLIPVIAVPGAILVFALWRCGNVLMPGPTLVSTDPSVGLDLDGTQTAVWHGSAHAMWPRYIGAACLVGAGAAGIAGLTLSTAGALSVAVPCVVIGVAALTFSRVGVVVDRRGLTVNYGVLPWPRTHIDMAQITSVAVADIVPMEHGGWGYRGSLRLMKKAAVVIRAGEGIHLGLDGDRRFVVTVDNADQGAGVLNDLLARTTRLEV